MADETPLIPAGSTPPPATQPSVQETSTATPTGPYVIINGQQVPITEYKVNIEGIGEIPLPELQRGYLRQADYTRKTQETAAERSALAELYRTLLQQSQAQSQPATPQPTTLQQVAPIPGLNLDYATDTEKALAQAYSQANTQLGTYAQTVKQLQDRIADIDLNFMLSDLKSQYPAINLDEVVRVANETQSTDLNLIAENLHLKTQIGKPPASVDKLAPPIGGIPIGPTPIDLRKANRQQRLEYFVQKYGGKLTS